MVVVGWATLHAASECELAQGRPGTGGALSGLVRVCTSTTRDHIRPHYTQNLPVRGLENETER